MGSSSLEVAQGGYVTEVNSDYWEHFRKSLLDETGGALGRKTYKEEVTKKPDVIL